MNWNKAYDNVVAHHLPRLEPYGSQLRDLVMHHLPVLHAWTAEACAMLEGFGQAEESDLAMLARMMERGSSIVLPAPDISELASNAIITHPRNMSLRCLPYDTIVRMSPFDDQATMHLARDIVKRVARDVMTASDMLRVTVQNSRLEPGTRTDATGNAHRVLMHRIGDMAGMIVLDVAPLCEMSTKLRCPIAA